MTGYTQLSESDILILIILKEYKNGLIANDILKLFNEISPIKYGPHQLTARLVKLRNKGYVYNIIIVPRVRTWFWGKDNGDLDMLDGDYNRRQLKEMVYEFIKQQSYPVLTVDVANYISKMNRVTYTSHQILGILFKLQNEGLIKPIRKYFGNNQRPVIYWVIK